MAHKLPGLLHRVLDGEGGESRLLFQGTFSVSGRNWRCNGEPRTSSLKDGAWWPQLSDSSLHLQLNTKGRDGNAQSLPEDGGARPRAAPERVAAQAQPPPAAARSKAQLRSEVGRGWEGKGARRTPASRAAPIPPQDSKEGEGWRFPHGAPDSETLRFQFSTRVPFPPLTGGLSHSRDRLPRQGVVRV